MIYSENILICIAVPLIVLIHLVQGKEKRLFISFILGMVMCLVGAYINTYFAVIFDMDATSIARYISPFVEEIMKMIPIVLFVLLREEHKDEVIQFAVAIGAGFATFENCCYLIQNGAENIGFILIRGMAVGIMHVVCALILGIGLNLIGKYKGTMIPGTVGAFSFAMTIHALYNLLVSDTGRPRMIGFCMPIIVFMAVYLVWKHAKDSIL